MSEKQIYKYPNGATLIYYQHNINKSTNAIIGFKVPHVDIPTEDESIFRYKNVISYWSDNNIRIPLIKPGIIHCAEHMFFKNLPNQTKEEIFALLRKTDTRYNAGTTQDFVEIDFDFPSKFADQIFKLESEMILRDKYTQKELDQEKEVIFQELQRSLDNDAQSIIDSYLTNNYSHLTSAEILGMYKEIIDSITPNELKRFTRTHFTSENLVISVVSDLPFEKIKQLVDDNVIAKVPSIPASNVKLQELTYNFSSDTEIIIPASKDLKTATILFAFKGKNNFEQDEKLAYLEDYVFNDFNGRLMQKFRQENQLTYTPSFYNDQRPNLNLKCFNITTTPEKVQECILTFTDLIREVAEKGLTDEEMQGFKEMWLNHRERKSKFKSHKAYALFCDYIYGYPVFVHNMNEKVKSLTKEDFDKYFKENYLEAPLLFCMYGNYNLQEIPTLKFITSQFRTYDHYADLKLGQSKEIDEFFDYINNPLNDLQEVICVRNVQKTEEEKVDETDGDEENTDDEETEETQTEQPQVSQEVKVEALKKQIKLFAEKQRRLKEEKELEK